MPIPASGPVSLSSIQTEFGGTNPVSIDEYYRGGANVPAIGTTTTIPASGTISFDNFHGTSDGVATLTVNVTPPSLTGFGTGTVSTIGATATPTGGTAPYTYSWTRISGDAAITAIAPTNATTAFHAAVSAGTPSVSAVFKCTVTATGGLVGSDTVDVLIEWDNGQ